MRQFVCSTIVVVLCLIVADSTLAQFDRSRYGSSYGGGFDRSRFSGFDRSSFDRSRFGGGPPSFGGGPPSFGGRPSFGGPSGGFDPSRYSRSSSDRGSDDRSRSYDRSRSDSSRSSRDSSSGRGSSSSKPKWSPPERVRVTVDLPEAWASADLNHDGQIGLYEWDRAKYAEFFKLDTNRDGLLTPQEISRSGASTPSAAAQLPAAGTSTAVAASSGRPSAPTTPSGSSASASPPAGGPITTVEFDAESQEGRWAKFVFGRLDRDKNGSISEDEWKQSQSTRRSFKKRNVKVSFPATFEQFGGLIVAVQRAEKAK